MVDIAKILNLFNKKGQCKFDRRCRSKNEYHLEGERVRILVTGGAGYIGSHIVCQLNDVGHEVVTYDNLSTGYKWAVLYGELIVGDLSDYVTLEALFEKYRFDSVFHLAASIIPEESFANPLKYYRNNLINTHILLELCTKYKVDSIVFSSSAAVYGMSPAGIVSEEDQLAPISPYGVSKMVGERMIMDLTSVGSMRGVILRYFNVAGADLRGRIGQATLNTTHLIKKVCQAALGRTACITVFGGDYPTRDGTCIRDYIHVQDVARSHIDALNYLKNGGPSTVCNVGYGHGYSVFEVIDMVKRISGADFKIAMGQRRHGDLSQVITDNSKIRKVLCWQPLYDNLETILRSSFEWEKQLPKN